MEKKQRNKLRYFTPEEWNKFINVIMNTKHEFIFNLLLNTGCRIHEAKSIKVNQINLERNYIELLKTKGNKPREVMLSSQFTGKLNKYIIQNKLKPSDSLGIPSNQFMDKVIKKYTQKAGLRNPFDFCCHTFRKTHENWLCALGVNSMIITAQLGHTVGVAQQYYISQTKFNQSEKMQIRALLGDLFQVDKSSTIFNQSQENNHNFYYNQEQNQLKYNERVDKTFYDKPL